MAITESKLKTGSLLLGTTPGVEFGCQPTNVRLEPSANETGDPLETLCGDTLSADTSTDWSLMGTSIQDFDDVDGFVMYAFDNDLTVQDYVWQPNDGTGTFSGEVQIRAVVIGGDVNVRLSTDFEWPCQAKPVHTPGAGTMTASGASVDDDEYATA